MKRLAKVALCVGIALRLVACAPSAETEPVDETLRRLAVATDLDPSERVVEIDLVAAAGVTQLEDGVVSSVLAYRDGGDLQATVAVPGPLIEANVGDRLVVHFRNELPSFSTTVHWHGLRLPVEMDGNPMVSGVVEPGGGFEYDFVLRDAGLFWYHPHVDTDVQLESGLQGILLVREADPPPVDRERIFVLDDVALEPDGTIDIELGDEDAMLGRRGPIVTVNGGPPGRIVSSPRAVERWRFVNTANGRYFDVSAEGLTFRVIGWDAGFIAAPYDVESIRIAPGERYDVLVQLPDDEGEYEAVTRALDRGQRLVDESAPLFEVAVRGRALASTVVDPNPMIEPMPDTEEVRRFALRSDLDGAGAPAFFINDQRWPLNTPLEVQAGDVDVWEVVNDEDHHHPFHIHGLFFQTLDPPPGTIGWKDTVDVAPRSTVRLAVPYGELGTWMFHCQIPEHAERGMMGDLVVSQ